MIPQEDQYDGMVDDVLDSVDIIVQKAFTLVANRTATFMARGNLNSERRARECRHARRTTQVPDGTETINRFNSPPHSVG